MALTTSTPLGPDFTIPDFSLPDVTSGDYFSPATICGEKGAVVAFMCRHCPYVVHVLPVFLELAREYGPRGLGFAGISSNNSLSHPGDAPERLREMAEANNFPFPLLYDESQEAARAFHAVCTPEFYVFDTLGKLRYHGRLDGSTPGNNVPCTGADLRTALNALLEGRPDCSPQHPGMGCNIKWK
ncbi:MAG: thioredoxin-dependent thiol peroxidase [Verrucomicrobiota bacterium]